MNRHLNLSVISYHIQLGAKLERLELKLEHVGSEVSIFLILLIRHTQRDRLIVRRNYTGA